MATSAALPLKKDNRRLFAFSGIGIGVIVLAVVAPTLVRSRFAAEQPREYTQPTLAQSSSIGKFGGVAPVSMALSETSASVLSPNLADERKMLHTSSLDLVVQHPGEAAEKIHQVVEVLGGFLVSSETTGGEASSGTITIRVPAARFEEARAQIRQLAVRVESERFEAQDVTRQYVDGEASLRDLRAEEAQYLSILKESRTVKDTLAVSEKLGEVRGQIDQQQSEFNALSKQVETVAMTISLRAETEAQVFGLHWRPLYRVKLALRDGLGAIADYSAAMASLIFYLPAILLWTLTIALGASLGWKALRWIGPRLFGRPMTGGIQAK